MKDREGTFLSRTDGNGSCLSDRRSDLWEYLLEARNVDIRKALRTRKERDKSQLKGSEGSYVWCLFVDHFIFPSLVLCSSERACLFHLE